MMLKKSTDSMILGIVEGVKAIISRGNPGTAAEMTLEGPIAERISARSSG